MIHDHDCGVYYDFQCDCGVREIEEKLAAKNAELRAAQERIKWLEGNLDRIGDINQAQRISPEITRIIRAALKGEQPDKANALAKPPSAALCDRSA